MHPKICQVRLKVFIGRVCAADIQQVRFIKMYKEHFCKWNVLLTSVRRLVWRSCPCPAYSFLHIKWNYCICCSQCVTENCCWLAWLTQNIYINTFSLQWSIKCGEQRYVSHGCRIFYLIVQWQQWTETTNHPGVIKILNYPNHLFLDHVLLKKQQQKKKHDFTSALNGKQTPVPLLR